MFNLSKVSEVIGSYVVIGVLVHCELLCAVYDLNPT